jgi:ribosome-associated protein
MDSKQLALLCRELADNRKAEDIIILDLQKLPGVTDFMVLCSGTSEPHLRAIEDEISQKLRDMEGIRPRAIDGTRHSGWIVLDYVDVLVHVMKPEVRAHYDLEGLWNDAPRVRVSKRKAARKKTAKPAASQSPSRGRSARPE